jgi:5-methylcytosine-specific restriction endonuclease McrA
MPYDKYLLTIHWISFKTSAILFARKECQLCGNNKEELNVHHKTYENRGCETFLDVVVLCKNCHAIFHNKS